MAYSTYPLDERNPAITRALIVVHGQGRNADGYFRTAAAAAFLGNALAWTWAEEGHDVRVLTRALPPGQAQHESGTGKPGITRVGWIPDSP